jgi:hypothetical protein
MQGMQQSGFQQQPMQSMQGPQQMQQPGMGPGQPDPMEMQMRQTHSDYDDVIQNHLPQVIQQNPEAKQDIAFAYQAYMAGMPNNLAQLAYEWGKTSPTYGQQQQSQQMSQQAQQIQQNLQKPGSLSQAGGGGAMDRSNFYATASDEEIERREREVLSGG